MRQLIKWVTILFVLMFAVGLILPRFGGSPPAGIAATQAEIASFKTALSMFQVDCGRLPSTAEGLAALMKPVPTIGTNRWRGPYLDRDPDWHATDPWGRAYVYKFPGEHNTNSYDIYSLGPNGKGGDEAIGNWPPGMQISREKARK
jgi:general secretion pathway protein G